MLTRSSRLCAVPKVRRSVGRVSRPDAVLAILLTMLASSAAAAPKVDRCPTIVFGPSAEAPTIDGKLDEAVWQQAPELGPFVDIAGGPAKSQTHALLLRADGVLWIGFVCGVSEGVDLKLDQTQRDSDVWTDESIEAFIDPGVTLRRYFHFVLNAANVQRDESGDKLAAPIYDASWDGAWQSATSRDGNAWYAEIAIPLAEVGLKPGASALIGLNVCRNDRVANQEMCWSPTIAGFHVPVRFGVVSLPNGPVSTHIELSIEGDAPGTIGPATQTVEARNAGQQKVNLNGLVIAGNEKSRIARPFKLPEVAPDATAQATASYEIAHSGDNAVVVALRDGAGRTLAVSKSVFKLSEAREQEYGYLVPGGGDLGLWWAESMYKVQRDKPVPRGKPREVQLDAAGREWEAVQIVVNPERDIEAAVTVSDFDGPGGAIPADSFRLYEVGYVPVNIPTDSFGWVADWPDPLPPLEGPLHCEAGQNQPLWLLAHVPPGTRPGRYRGHATISAGPETVEVPVALRVYGFDLIPDTHTRTAYGVGPDFGFLGVTDPEQQRQVYDLYMQSCRDHRIAPYNPMRFYPMDIQLHGPMLKLAAGRMAIEFERGQQHPWKLYWNGEQIATQRTSMTHFEKEGVGYEGTGVSWPYIEAIESVTEVSTTENMRVLEIVGAHASSGAAARSFRLTFRFFIPAGDNWFAMRLMEVESTDPTEIEMRNYYNIPQTTFKAEQVANGSDFAAWSGDGVGFGMLCLGGGVGGLKIEPGQQGVTVSNGVQAFRIKEGQTHPGWGPLVVYFVTDDTSAQDLATRAEELRNRINAADPAAYTPANRVAVSEERREDYEFTHDFTAFDEGASRYLDEFHFNAYNQTCMPGSIAGQQRFTEQYKRFHKLMWGPVIEHLRAKGWLKYAYSYWFDEPTPERYAHVAEGMRLLGQNCPGLTRLLTEQPEPELHGAIDLWVPVLAAYVPEACHARQAAGDDVWWYVCCGPHAPYPNNFVDHPGINHRIRFWMAEKYRVQGSLYWSTTHYGSTPDGQFRNPWNDGMTYRPSGGYWGNGDGMLLYPACREQSDKPVIDGPVVSIRWELLRDGIEDREYFWTLRQEIERLQLIRRNAESGTKRKIDAAIREANRALGAPDRLAESLVEYTKDPQDLLRERTRLAEAIERCRRIGCGKRPFSIIESRVCKTVNAAGQPGPQATSFTSDERRVYVWFRYAGAVAGQTIKVKFTHTDEAGNKSNGEIEAELKPGDSVGYAQMAPVEGQRLAPGTYEAQLTNESDIGYGTAMVFTVE
jgi:hypothetical protein